MTEVFMVSAAAMEKKRHLDELNRERTARWRTRHHKASNSYVPISDKEFIIWDGEGPQDTGYSLIGNSEGDMLCYPHLSSLDMLEFIIAQGAKYPGRVHIGFGFGYDVSNILCDAPIRVFNKLQRYNRCYWKGYKIEHIPRKWFKVRYGHITVKIYDVHSFFNSGLVKALTTWEIGPFAHLTEDGENVRSVPSLREMEEMSEQQIVKRFKALRSEFQWKDIEPIAIYMSLELKYTKCLIGALRDSFEGAGFKIKSWHGPGALAMAAIKKHRIKDAMAICPEGVRLAAKYGFFGGRFEQFHAGRAGQHIFCADINSAYPYYCAQLPNLSKGHWRHSTIDNGRQGVDFEPGKFAIYRIAYKAEPDSRGVYPLPYRDKHHGISWPFKVESWYWAPEAELVANDPRATFLEKWVFDEIDNGDRPFSFIIEYYEQRQLFKRDGNPAEYCLKLVINAIFGQLAKRKGWDRKHRKAPNTHQLEWAGYITSCCRAAVYKAALQQGFENLISIDTDGVMGLKPFDLPESSRLGDWKLTEYKDGIFWQSGMYFLRDDDGWSQAKTRGIPKGQFTLQDIYDCLTEGRSFTHSSKNFISYGLALMSIQEFHQKLNTWQDTPHTYKMGGAGKRQHFKCGSKMGCKGDWHGLRSVILLVPDLIGPAQKSYPHVLPWEIEPDGMKIKFDTLMAFRTEDMEEWMTTHRD